MVWIRKEEAEDEATAKDPCFNFKGTAHKS